MWASSFMTLVCDCAACAATFAVRRQRWHLAISSTVRLRKERVPSTSCVVIRSTANLDLNLITNNPPCPPPPFVGAVTPGMCTDAVMHPIDTTRARVQVGVGLGSGPPHSPVRAMWLAFTNTVRTEGVRGLYGGYTTAMLFSAPTNALYFLSYETAKHKLAHSGRFGKPGEGTPSVHLLAGLAAEIGAS